MTLRVTKASLLGLGLQGFPTLWRAWLLHHATAVGGACCLHVGEFFCIDPHFAFHRDVERRDAVANLAPCDAEDF